MGKLWPGEISAPGIYRQRGQKWQTLETSHIPVGGVTGFSVTKQLCMRWRGRNLSGRRWIESSKSQDTQPSVELQVTTHKDKETCHHVVEALWQAYSESVSRELGKFQRCSCMRAAGCLYFTIILHAMSLFNTSFQYSITFLKMERYK